MADERQPDRPAKPRRRVRPHRAIAIAAIVVGLVTFFAFLPSLTDGFVFDDGPLITGNEYVHALKWVPRAFQTHLWDISPIATDQVNGAIDTSRRYYRPLITLSHLFTWLLAKDVAWPYHLTNVVAHALTAWLATRAATRWTRSLSLGAIVGIVFALHPTRCENVLWISGRMDVLMLLFALVALEGFHRYDANRKPTTLAWAVLAFGAAILCKEPAALLPLVVFAERPRRTRASVIVPTVIGVAYSVVRLFVMRPDGNIQRVLTPKAFLFTIGVYAERVVIPWPPVMYYHVVPFGPDGWPNYGAPMLALGTLVLVAYAAAVVFAFRRDRVAFWLLVAGVAFIGPLLNLWFIGMKEAAQDRFLYAPLLFALGGLARLARAPLRRVFRRGIARFAVAGLALAAVGLIELRTLDYRDDHAFWTAELAYNTVDPYVIRMSGLEAAGSGNLPRAYELFRRADSPEIAPYDRAPQLTTAHFQEASFLAALLPDGRVEELTALDDELYRTVDPSHTPRPRSVLGYPVGQALFLREIKRLHGYGSFSWDAALIATRVGNYARASAIVATIASSRAPANGLNGVLVYARIEKMDRARALLAELRHTNAFADQAGAADYDVMDARLNRAEHFAAARDAAANKVERATNEAMRLAELGAFWGAFRALAGGDALNATTTESLAMQLLVACRLDEAATTFAKNHADTEAAATVAGLVATLPPVVQAMEPVATPLDRVIALATQPF